MPTSTGNPAARKPAWPHWNSKELFRIQDLCLIAIEDRKPLDADWLDALPPWRAVMMARIAALTAGPVDQITVDMIGAKALLVGGGVGPGWLTGRRGLTCADCGRTTWHLDPARFEHSGACQAPPTPDRHPITNAQYVIVGDVLMSAALARQAAEQAAEQISTRSTPSAPS